MSYFEYNEGRTPSGPRDSFTFGAPWSASRPSINNVIEFRPADSRVESVNSSMIVMRTDWTEALWALFRTAGYIK